MNEKLNTVFDIINATNTVSANRYLSHALGAEVAIIYNALLAKYAYYSKHDMIPDDWFYSTIDDLWRSTALSEKTQKRAIAILVKEGLIECKRKGMPAKRSFFICNAYEKIVALIEKGKAILGETTAETAKSKAIEGDSAVPTKRQNKNSRKSATSYAVSAEHTYKTKENNQKLRPRSASSPRREWTPHRSSPGSKRWTTAARPSRPNWTIRWQRRTKPPRRSGR